MFPAEFGGFLYADHVRFDACHPYILLRGESGNFPNNLTDWLFYDGIIILFFPKFADSAPNQDQCLIHVHTLRTLNGQIQPVNS